MSIFIIGDIHLSFSPDVQKPMDVFGDEWQDHDLKIENAWRSIVRDDDTVIVAGDISWGLKLAEAMPDIDFVSSLPGKKIFIKGNHDLWWSGIGRLNKLHEDITFLQNTFYEAGDVAICGSRGWVCPGSDDFSYDDERIYDRELLRLEFSLKAAKDAGYKGTDMIGVMHYPPTNDKKQPSGFTDLFEKYKVKDVFYGHLHGKGNFDRGPSGNMNGITYKLISADAIGFAPLRIR